MGKRRRAIAAMIICALVLSGCKASDNTPENERADKGNVITSDGKQEFIGENLKYDVNSVVNNGEKVELTIWTDPDYEPYYKEACEKYSNIHKNVTFNVVSQPWEDYWTKLPLALQNGNGPDIFRIHEAYLDTLEQYILPLSGEVFPEAELTADFPAITEIKVNGNYYSIPLSSSFGAGIYYNKDMWKAAGLTENDIPNTWDDFINVAQKLTKKDEKGNFLQYGFSTNKVFEEFVTELNYQKGAPLFKDDQYTWNLDNEVMYNNIEFIRSLADKYGIMEYIPNDNEDEFGHGQAAMIYQYNWVGGYITETYPEINWGFFLMPTEDGNVPPAYGNKKFELTLSVTKSGDVIKEAIAQDFLKYFICENESYKKLVIYSGGIPVKENLLNDSDVMSNEAIIKAAAVADRMVYIGLIPTNEARQQGLKKLASEIYINGADPRKSIQALQKELMDNAKKNEMKYKSVESNYQYYNELPNR